MKKFKNTIEPFAVGYIEADREYAGYKIASGMREWAKHKPIYIEPQKYFVGHFEEDSTVGVRYTYGRGIEFYPEIIDEEIRMHPEFKEELNEIKSIMAPVRTKTIIQARKTELEKNMVFYDIGWGGDGDPGWGGHSNPGYDVLLHEGTNGLREKINRFRKINTGKDDFYDAAEISLEALEILALRYKTLAEEMLLSSNKEDSLILKRIVSAFENIPQNPPRDFFEACQMFWLEFCFDGIDSPGRFDMYMIEFYRKTEETDRKECLEKLWQLFQDFRAWNLCLSGSDENWQDQTNELTYDVLEVARKFKYNTPNITVRVHRNTPDELWESIAKTIGTGIGMPAVYNDEVVCPALEALGIKAEDTHNYCMNGCNQIDIFGKSHMGLEDGEVSLAKCLRFVLYNGVCDKTGLKTGAETGDPRNFESFEEFMTAYDTQVKHFTDIITTMANKSQESYAKYAPNPYRSNMIEGCLETARDHKDGGPLYNNGQILMQGVADAADSLVAIKHYIYDTSEYTMEQLIDALDKDFEGYDDLYRDFSTYHKFGNEHEDVDEIFKYIVESFAKYLLTKKTYRGGVYGVGCSTFARAAMYGYNTGSLPNGKKSTSTLFAESIGAVPGCDIKGPTALINSVLSIDHQLAKSGLVLQMKFNKDTFNTKTGLNAFIALAKTYMENGGQQLSINVLSKDELIKAQKEPEKYKNLVVRVGGYSDYFVNLSPNLQENIIKRTEQMV